MPKLKCRVDRKIYKRLVRNFTGEGSKIMFLKDGRWWHFLLSPFNPEETASFVIDSSGWFHCYSSGEHGSLKMLARKYPELLGRRARHEHPSITIHKRRMRNKEVPFL